jgi:hypothetical protein
VSMRRTRKSLTPDAPLAPVPSEILDQFVGRGPISHEELEAAVRRFKKAIIERALGGELTHHLGYPPGGTKPEETTNHRNGTGGKTVLTDDGPLAIEVPRDREGTFEPRFVAKPGADGEKRTGVDVEGRISPIVPVRIVGEAASMCIVAPGCGALMVSPLHPSCIAPRAKTATNRNCIKRDMNTLC